MQRSGYLHHIQTRKTMQESFKLAFVIACILRLSSWNNHDSLAIHLLFLHHCLRLGCEQESLRFVSVHFCHQSLFFDHGQVHRRGFPTKIRATRS